MLSIEDYSKILGLLPHERDAITYALAMMAYNPAIGRVLEKRSVDRFCDLMIETVPKLYNATSKERFDALHEEICDRILQDFKTNRGNALAYGQAQKAVNVFFKVYVDWAGQPQPDLAKQLAPLLHVPLDSLLMKYVKREFRQLYNEKIDAIRHRHLEHTTDRIRNMPEVKSFARPLARSLVGNEFALVTMNKEVYLAWQNLLRLLYPAKPIALDVVWVLERKQLKATAAKAM